MFAKIKSLLPNKSVAEYQLIRLCNERPIFSYYNRSTALYGWVKHIFLMLGRIMLCVLQPKLCAFGFVAGIIWEDSTYASIEKVKDVWKGLYLGRVPFMLGSALALPAVFIMSCLASGASLGSQLAFKHTRT